MLKKIYKELKSIRKELRAIRVFLESGSKKYAGEQLYRKVREPYAAEATYVPVE